MDKRFLFYKIGNAYNFNIKGRKSRVFRYRNKNYLLIYNKKTKILFDVEFYKKLMR